MTVRPITIDFETESHNIITDIKHGKGNFTYRVDDENQSSQVISLPEINNNIYLDLYVQYYWTNSSGSNNNGNNNYNTCNLKLNWMPRYSDNKEYINELSPEFNQTNNNIKIQFNDESLISISKSLKISDPESEPGWQGQISFDGSESKRNIEIRFTYEYTNNGVTYYVSGLNDTYSLKIFPPSSKYARNVVFNEEGINELVGYFKQYPITKLENGEKYGHIKITKGIDEESEVSPKGLENSTEDLLLCSTDFSPSENNSFDLGTSNIEYKQLYSSQPVHFDSETGTYSSSTTFSTEGLNEIIAVEGNCTIISTYREDSQGEHQITKIYSPAPNVSTTVQDNSIIIEWYGNRPPAPAINGGKTRESMMSNFRVSITTRKTDAETDNLYWKNLYLSDTVYANELKGKYTGLPTGEEGEIININDKFIVDSEGNVHMAGNLSWGKNGVDTIQAVYHPGVGENRTIPPIPENNTIDFPDVSTTDWHFNYNSNNDYWMSFSFNSGETWNNPMKVRAEDGKPGVWTSDNIIQALKSINQQGIFTFENPAAGSNESDKLIGISVSAILAALIEANRININGGPNYNPTNPTLFTGGYITFRVPTPWTSTHALNTAGFNARLGYLRGTGNTVQNTAGIGIALQTQATYNEAFPNAQKTEGDKLHLLIASLMLTDSGLGVTLAANTGSYTNSSNDTWLTTDYGFSGGYHYIYKYIDTDLSLNTWSLGRDSDDNVTGKRGFRLWLHEDNGGLYFLDSNGVFQTWRWVD